MATRASFILEDEILENIRKLAKEAGKKQSQIIKEAIREYAETIEDYAIARRVDREIEAYERGEMKTYTADEARAIINAA
jgi:predicted DNA-binding protein